MTNDAITYHIFMEYMLMVDFSTTFKLEIAVTRTYNANVFQFRLEFRLELRNDLPYTTGNICETIDSRIGIYKLYYLWCTIDNVPIHFDYIYIFILENVP